jgi:hypothetical protein
MQPVGRRQDTEGQGKVYAANTEGDLSTAVVLVAGVAGARLAVLDLIITAVSAVEVWIEDTAGSPVTLLGPYHLAAGQVLPITNLPIKGFRAPTGLGLNVKASANTHAACSITAIETDPNLV